MLAAAIVVLGASELTRIYLGGTTSIWVTRLAFLVLGIALVTRFSLREWVMTAMACVLTLGVWLRGETEPILAALDRAAFFAAFIYLVTLLKEAAQRSRSVLELGSYLTRQPQGRRYYSLSIGGHLMGVLLNFGAISLLTPLIQRGAKTMAARAEMNAPTTAELEQQQISALLRGFSWMILWSPTALTQVVLATSFADARAMVVIPLGIGASVVMIGIGRAFDRREWRHLRRAGPVATAPELPTRAACRFALICLILIGAAAAVVLTAQVTPAIALMLVAPILMIVWTVQQNLATKPGAALSASLHAFGEIFVRPGTGPAISAYILGTAGYIGVAAAALAPVDEFARVLGSGTIPPWMVLTALPVLITLGGQLALSPILTVVFLSAVLNELPTLPADPNLIVFALGAGWALSMTASPNASATLLISSIAGIAPTTLTWRWNGLYALACLLTFAAAFRVLTL